MQIINKQTLFTAHNFVFFRYWTFELFVVLYRSVLYLVETGKPTMENSKKAKAVAYLGFCQAEPNYIPSDRFIPISSSFCSLLF